MLVCNECIFILRYFNNAQRESNGHIKKIGEGGYGFVFRAINNTNGRPVAIKVTHADQNEINLMLKIG